MSSNSDTLNIAGMRSGNDLPMRDVASAKNPEAAAYARARIDAITEQNPLLDPAALPTLPTTELETDRSKLAARLETAPTARRIPTAIQPLLTAIGIFALMLLILKSPVIISQVQYATSAHTPQATQASAVSTVVPADPTITIPKINVHAPVVYEPSVAEASIQKALQSGVVHYGNTAFPGQVGNTVIFGHSSNDWWEPGNYKFVFVLLDKLVAGDQFTVDYQSKRYTYQVTSSRVVPPTEVSVLAQTATPTLTLITCSPPGTSVNRLIITANQIDPSPLHNATATAAAPTTATNLPSAAPSLLDQVGQAINGIIQGVSSLFGAGHSSTGTPSATPQTTGQLPATK